MSLPQIDKKLLKLKTDELVSDLISFSRTLPDEQIYRIKERLYYSAKDIPNGFLDENSVKKPSELIMDLIKLGGRIDQCKDYLNITKTLRYGNPDDLIDKLNELKKLTKIAR